MVADMELKPEEIETLRAAIAHNPSLNAVSDAGRILDRLSPPSPEVDEATLVWREMNARGAKACGSVSQMVQKWRSGGRDSDIPAVAEIVYLREVLAAKDAERDEYLKSMSECVEAQLSDKDAELAALRAENERLKESLREIKRLLSYAGQDACSLAQAQANKNQAWHIASKAAERNPAEPATDTAPVVEVTEGDNRREIVDQVINAYHATPLISDPVTHILNKDSVNRLFHDFRTEAEARGRREALEKLGDLVDKRWAGTREGAALRGLLIELKRMMTGGK